MPPASEPDLAVCRALLRDGSRSFYLASHLLPRRVREPAIALYAFCRLADDAIDRTGGGAEALAQLQDRLARAYAGQPTPIPADRALAAVVSRFAIPSALPRALLEGLSWDAAGRRYETLQELTEYALRVAGSVGAMMALIMGARCPAVLARACDLGVAMQFSNIARDVGEDARAGRLYLPAAWLREAGVAPDTWLAAPRFRPEIGQAVRRLLAEANRLYASADAGIAALPRACRPGIRAARLLYAEIGATVARNGYDSVTERAVVPAMRKARMLARTMRAPHDPGMPEAATAWLLLGAVPPLPTLPRAPSLRSRAENRAVFVIELFHRLALRERMGAAES